MSFDILFPYFIVNYFAKFIILFIGFVSKNIANSVINRMIKPNPIYIIIV